jgi:hypothetical protein
MLAGSCPMRSIPGVDPFETPATGNFGAANFRGNFRKRALSTPTEGSCQTLDDYSASAACLSLTNQR